MTPAGSSSRAWLLDDALGERAHATVAPLALSESVHPTARAPLPHELELRCADVHSPGCEQALRAQRADQLVELARGHGALVHSFAPAWYARHRPCACRGAEISRVADPASRLVAAVADHAARALVALAAGGDASRRCLQS